VVGLWGTACGSSDQGLVDTELPPDQRLSTLSDAEHEQLCVASQAAMVRVRARWESPEAQCVRDGLRRAMGGVYWQGSFRETCRYWRDECVDRYDELAEYYGDLVMLEQLTPRNFVAYCPSSVGGGCDATVADYEACASAQIASADEMYQPLASCASDETGVEAALSAVLNGTPSAAALPECHAVISCEN
jgi:hypothetical protein